MLVLCWCKSCVFQIRCNIGAYVVASPPAGPIGAGVSNLPGTREPVLAQFETIGGEEKAKLEEEKKPGGHLFDCGRICLG